MDIFNNVLEGTRQYFMGVPKQVQPESTGQSVWPSGAPLPEEGAPAQSGAPAPSSRPPSAAAAPPAPIATPVPVPPRPPSEPLEPEPHIIHKATVMREAAEKRREMPDIEDEEEPAGTLSPPSHIIRKPQRGERSLPSPAPAPAAPSPSPARPPSEVPLPPSSEPQLEPPVQYRPTMHRVQTPTVRPPDHFAPSRPPDPYGPSRPPDSYPRYHYETNTESGRSSHGSITSTQPSAPQRQSPLTYTRISNSMPQHTASRLRDSAAHSPPAQRYVMPLAQPPPPHNDRVPPIHHPQPLPSGQRHMPVDSRSTPMYANLQQRRETSPYARASTQYDRHQVAPPRKYDHQQAYPGYRPSAAVPQVPQPMQNHRVDIHPQVQYKPAAVDVINTHYATRTPDRHAAPSHPPHEAARLQSRGDYLRSIEGRPSYHYLAPSTSTSRYGSAGTVPVVQSTSQSRTPYRSAAAPKSNYVYPTSTPVQISPARSTVKPGYPNQKARMTVSVTSIVNEINGNKQKRRSPGPNTTQVNAVSQTKQKRESPLDLSVKTVKNSADSSTTQDDAVDSMTIENKPTPLHTRPSSSSRLPHVPLANYVGSLKVDFAPNFIQYGERNAGPNYSSTSPAGAPARYNGSFNPLRPVAESYPTESPNLTYPERKYSVPVGRSEFPQIDLTQPIGDQAHPESRVRDDRHFIIEERKRPDGPIVSNIPEKMVRYETWSADSRIEHGIMNPSAREHHDLLRRPVYSYTSHKQTEAYRNEQKRLGPPLVYRELHPHANHRYPSNNYPSEALPRENRDYHHHYHERNQSHSRHHVIQKTPSHRDIHPHHMDPNSGIPADKRVLSILRNSLETKQSSYTESPRPVKQVPDLIVIDDVDDSVIEITDLTKDNEIETTPAFPKLNHLGSNLDQQLIKMPKAVDSIPRDSDDYKPDTNNAKSKSPENDVASRIRTKAELKVMPPTQDNTIKTDTKQSSVLSENDKTKILPKSQKQHLFNQIREDNLRMKSVIKKEKPVDVVIPEVKTEPMNIDEIERDAEMSLKTEDFLDSINPNDTSSDLDWASACDNFMEQLKSGCHKKKTHRRRVDTLDQESENKAEKVDLKEPLDISEKPLNDSSTVVKIKQEPADDDEINHYNDPTLIHHNTQLGEEICHKDKKSDDENVQIDNSVREKTKSVIEKTKSNQEKSKHEKKNEKSHDKPTKPTKIKSKSKIKPEKNDSSQFLKKEIKEKEPIKTIIKEELESTDDDEPLINSKIFKEKKEQSDRMKYQLLKDLSEKSAYVKLECCDVDVNKNNRKSLDSMPREREEKLSTGKLSRQSSRSKIKNDNNQSEKRDVNSTSDSEDDHSVAIRLRKRKNTKNDDNKTSPAVKTPVKSSPMKKFDNSSASSSSTPVRKPGFGDGSDFHPGWEEELYKYKRSLRMPSRLIAIPRGRSGGPFFKGSGALFTRGSTSLPDLDPAPLSPAPSSAPSAATDDIYARRPDKLTLDSDLDSNSSYSAPNRLNYDSEASTSTVFSSSKTKNKGSSIVDVLIQKCGKKDELKKKSKDKDDRVPKVIPKSSNTTELLATPSLGLGKNGTKGILSVRKEKIMEDIFYLGAFRKETVTAFRNAFIENTGGIIGATEEFSAVVLKSRTRTESRVLKQRATIKEVFGDERPASAPPTSCRDDDILEDKDSQMVEIKKEPEAETEPKSKFKSKKMNKDKLQRRSSSIRDGLRSTKSLKRNDAKGRLLRLKKRNSLINSLNSKRMKDISNNKPKSEYNAEDKNKPKEESSSLSASEVSTKRRLKRLFGRRKFSSGFDYIRKKKKIIRREDAHTKIRRPAVKPSPESVHDIQKEIKSWFINKSIGETHLHRAARLGYTDCVAYCLEKMESEPSSKDNAGFTPLHVAAAKGHVPIARLLLQYGANVSAAAQGGIRPLHEACENCHVEIIRLLLAYGADPLLGTYAGQTPEELTEGPAALLLRLHIADVQGFAVEPWRFPPLAEIIDRDELGCDPLSSPPPASPPPPPDSMVEIQCTEAPLPPFYTLRTTSGQPADGLWCLLQDITNLLQIKSKDNLLKQIHCGSGSPKELLREIRTQEFLERAQCHQLLCAGEKVNVRASKVALVRVTDKLRQLLKIETVLVS